MKWFIGFAVVLACAFALYMKAEPTRKTCERLDTGVCLCEQTGVCLCEPGFRSCPACRHLRSPTEQEAKHQAGLKAFAERLKAQRNQSK